jgi:hypothetical protein
MTSNGMTRVVEGPTAASAAPRGNDEHDADSRNPEAPSASDGVDGAAAPVDTGSRPEAPVVDVAPAVAQEPASVPPTPLESRAAPHGSLAPAVEISEDWVPRSTFWGARPNRTWMLVGGSAIVIAFLVGTVTGRVTGPERSAEYVPPETGAPAAAPEPVSVNAAPMLPSSASPATPNAPQNETSPSKAALRGASNAPANDAPTAKRGLPAFNTKAAKSAIDGVSSRLNACKHAGDPVGPASVVVTFGPTGRVSNAAVTTAGYAGTRTGNCVVERLRELRIPEFTGAPVTVKRSVSIR